MSNVNLLSNLSLYGALIMEVDNSGWPANPKLGTFIMKDSNLYGYLKIGGLETWYPFSHHTVSYVHTQGLPSTTWIVNHGLGTKDLWIQVKDTTGNIIGVGKEDIDSNSFRLTFTSAVTGTVMVVAPDSIDVPEVKAQLLDIGNGSVSVNSSGIAVTGGDITVNGSSVLTSANIQPQIDSSIAAVVGAAPAALDTLKEIADQLASDESAVAALTTTVAGKANAVHTHVISDVTGLQNALNAKAATSSLATVATSGSYADLTNKPSLFSGSYTDLSNKPTLSMVASTGSYNDLVNKPTLFSGAYSDLTGKPTLFSGAYADLTGKPSIPSKVSDLTNDTGFQTASDVTTAINNVVGAAPSV